MCDEKAEDVTADEEWPCFVGTLPQMEPAEL